MLELIVPSNELYDEKTNSFTLIQETKLLLEHSLISIADWESKWGQAFLTKRPKTTEQSLDYIRCMTLNKDDVNPNVYLGLTQENISVIYDYINNPMSATCLSEDNAPPGKDVVTAELIYYWMISLQIPAEYASWHINRLLKLIRVCDIKNKAAMENTKGRKGRKTPRLSNEALHRRAALNEQRLKQYNTTG